VTYTVRDATVEDATGMGLVNVLAWQVGYVGLFPQEYLDRRDPTARTEFWRKEIGAADPLRRNLVAVEEGEVIGLVAFGRVQITRGDDWTGEPEPGVGELTVLNVHPDRWSRGVGSALLAEVDTGMPALGFGSEILWVIKGNTRARRFYERHGWGPDGGTLYVAHETAVFDQVRYRKPLGGSAG
jgi:GNAT superfamily N-acetyltransferase